MKADWQLYRFIQISGWPKCRGKLPFLLEGYTALIRNNDAEILIATR